ncbi:MAG: MFS transporter, partial [Planctomycetes bacterium]|nr:MFS transporter [Planctomycetota bacterium]
MRKNVTPWAWVPTLYFAEGLPYFLVNVISVTMFKRLGMDNAELAFYTGLLYLPWVAKPLWSPFVDLLRTRRWWVVATQAALAAAFAAVACSVAPVGFAVPLTFFYVAAVASATHDIAADGYDMAALDGHRQSLFVGLRATFYRISSVFAQGVIVVAAGLLEELWGDVPRAWAVTFGGCSGVLALLA